MNLKEKVSSARRWLADIAKRDLGLLIWSVILLLLILVSIVGPLLLVGPNLQDIPARLEGPSFAHPFGTDQFGRDILSRTVSAGQVSLGLGAIITIISVALGAAIGVISGYYRGASAVLMRLMDALLAFPAIVLAITLIVALGSENGALAEVIALTVVFTPYIARVVRARTLVLAQKGFIMASRGSGTHSFKILLIHVIPNALPTILVQATFVYATTLLADASLSFLGLGVPAPTPTWGNMVAEAKPYIVSSPLFIIAPGAAIVIAVMAFNLIGDGVRGLIDPRARAVLSLQLLARNSARSARSRARASTSPVAEDQAAAK